jgi:hypothetical protein
MSTLLATRDVLQCLGLVHLLRLAAGWEVTVNRVYRSGLVERTGLYRRRWLGIHALA